MKPPNAHLPIGLFDSGVGGLTVMQALMRALPNESLIYYGDTARLPYGNKGKETIIRYCRENIEFLLEKGIKMAVVACNTATALALPEMQEIFRIPIVGVIEAGACIAAATTSTGVIAVLGTRGTINSGAYQRAITSILPQATVIGIPCPLFVPIVEEGMGHHPSARLIVEEYLAVINGQPVDTILLGCTHYPLLRQQIQEAVGPSVNLVDSAFTCADQVAALLKQLNLSSTEKQRQHSWYVSEDPEKFQELAQRVFHETDELIINHSFV